MSVVKKGMEAAMAGSGKAGKFLTLQADTPVDVVLFHGLDEVQTVDQHDWWDYNPAPHLVCLGDDCPSCALGHEARPKSYYGIVTKEKEAKYFPVGPSILGQLQKYEKAVGDISGRVVRFEKTGSGLKTRYSVVPLGKKLDISGFELPDLESLLGPLTVEDQLARLNDAGVDTAGVTVTKTKKAAPKKAAKKAEAPAEGEAEAEATPKPEGEGDWDLTGDDEAAVDGWAEL